MSDLTSIHPVAAPDPAATTASAKPPPPPTSPGATASASAPAPSPPPSASTEASATPTAGNSAGIPYQLHYDVETQRFILEARDPKTGAIIISLPPQTAFQQIQSSASATAPSPLGNRVDKNA